ncbi:hypothetical protein [Stieleria magnilauensis]
MLPRSVHLAKAPLDRAAADFRSFPSFPGSAWERAVAVAPDQPPTGQQV